MNVDRLVHVEHAVHPPAERVEDVMRVLGAEPAEHDARLIGLAVAVGVLEMQHLGRIGQYP